MSKFKENDRVWIETGELGVIKGVGVVYSIETYNGDEIMVRESDLSFQDLMNEPIEEYEESSFSVDDYFSEMASIAYYKGLNIAYNDEADRLGIAYFKVYDHVKIRSAKRVARLHFKDSGMEYHNDTIGKQPWILNSRDIKDIINLLKQPNDEHDGLTHWQVLCYRWNRDNKLLPMGATINKYFDGEYDNQHFNDTRLENAYVLSTQEMPDTWIYDPPKGKK
jgi:hypothetical protein